MEIMLITVADVISKLCIGPCQCCAEHCKLCFSCAAVWLQILFILYNIQHFAGRSQRKKSIGENKF